MCLVGLRGISSSLTLNRYFGTANPTAPLIAPDRDRGPNKTDCQPDGRLGICIWKPWMNRNSPGC
jgi:hypothetical protein